MLDMSSQYPLRAGAWDMSDNPCCLLALAARHEIPYIAVADFSCPKLERYLRQNPQDAILATDGPIMRGSILYAARYGIISVHAAQLPTFRGNWTTYFNLYHNLPLVVSAFIMQPWVDEGVLLASREVPIARGMTLEQINEASLRCSVGVAVEVLQQIGEGSVRARRQEPWEGVVYRGAIKNGVLQPAMPEAVQKELAARLAEGTYAFYREE